MQELSLYQPSTTDLCTLEQYREELIAGVYLSGLRSSIVSQIRGQVFSGTHVPDMTLIFSSALRVSTRVTLSAGVTSSTRPSSSTSSLLPESSAVLVSGTRGRDGGRNSKATTSRGGRPTAKGKKIFSPCTYCGKIIHALEKCWKEFGKLEWAQAMFSSTTPSPTPPSLSKPLVGPTIQMTFTSAEYKAWKQSKASTSTASLASTSGTHAFLAFRSSWVIDSEDSAHMTRTPSTLSSLTPTTAYPPLSIADGCSCSVKGYALTKPTPSLTLHNILYVPGFPTNLLSLSTITRTLNCVAIFYPFHCVFQDLRIGQRIGLGHENGREIYELVSDYNMHI